jgi:hypothetical protein
MDLIFKYITVASIAFVIILSADGYNLNYTFSESIPSTYSVYSHSNNFIPNQTSLNTGCDFLNLCGKAVDNKFGEASLPFNNKIVDISYLNSFIELPFP